MSSVSVLEYGEPYIRGETITYKIIVISTSETRAFRGLSTSIDTFIGNVFTSIEISPFATLKTFLGYLASLSGKDLTRLLLRYADENTLSLFMKIKPVDIRKLVALLLWIESRYDVYGKPLLDLVFDPETNEFQFLNIVLPECDWGPWRKIVKEIKREKKRNGLEEMTSKVSIVCLRGLLEPTL